MVDFVCMHSNILNKEMGKVQTSKAGRVKRNKKRRKKKNKKNAGDNNKKETSTTRNRMRSNGIYEINKLQIA